jgi:hypothetical protein
MRLSRLIVVCLFVVLATAAPALAFDWSAYGEVVLTHEVYQKPMPGLPPTLVKVILTIDDGAGQWDITCVGQMLPVCSQVQQTAIIAASGHFGAQCTSPSGSVCSAPIATALVVVTPPID